MKNILNNRILVILSIFVILITSLCTSCFASSDLKFSNDETYTLSDFSEFVGNDSYIIVYGSNKNLGKRFLLLPYNKEQYKVLLYKSGDYYSLQLHSIDTDGGYNYSKKYTFRYCLDKNSAWLSGTTSDSSGFYFDGGIECVYTTDDIYDTEGNLVFQGAPQIPEITKTLVEQTTQTQIQEQLKLMITGFLKYLIVFVISVIAFWKGWKFLSKQLKRA